MDGRRRSTYKKRSGKYPSMRGGIPDSNELKNLLYAISEAFPLVISANLTKNTYKILEYENFATKKATESGVFDDLVTVGVTTIDPAHRNKFIETFSRDKLLEAYAKGEKKVAYECRQLKDNGEYGWIKTTVIFLKNHDNNEVLEITLAGPIEEQKARELENYRLRKLMESVMLANYEYVSILNKRTGTFELSAKNEINTHRVPLRGDYDTVLITIRETLIPKEDRGDYYDNLKLPVLIERMAENPLYSYRYRLCDTPEMRWREVTYSNCTPEEDDILMTVRDVHGEVMAELLKREEETLQRNKELQKLLNGLGLEVVLDHDLITGHAEVLGETDELLKRDLIRENFPQGEIDAGMIHPDDIGILVKTEDLGKAGDTFSVDFRMKRGDGSFFWCRCRGVVLRDENGKPYRCLYKLTDIDSQKKSEQKLMYDAQRDSLTGLYNNMTTYTLIENYLAGEGAGLGHALLVLDIDNLKEVNDSLGHKAGDRLIQSLAKVMTSSLRSTDIIGRVGGDEFVVLLKNIESSSNVLESLYAMKKRIKPLKVDEKTCILPMFSIGVSLYPQDGRTYDELFRHADAAMYYIKGHGKNGIKLYESAIDSVK